MRIRKYSLVCACILVLLVAVVSCEKNDESYRRTGEPRAEDTSTMIEGMVRVKLQRVISLNLKVSLKSGKVKTSNTSIDALFSSIGVHSFTRTFPHAGKFEARSVACGLDLWYDIKYDTTLVRLDEVLADFRQLSEFVVTEGVAKIKSRKYRIVPMDQIIKKTSALKAADFDYPFNDSYLSYQWHYHNTGDIEDATEGCDINLFDGWQKQTGQSNVIVAVVDGGIQVNHADLAANMWVNEGEESNDLDTDGNGYKDDVNGYNFVKSTGVISPNDHGTHVAGTIAAVNDNGIGVCGVAGGDATHPGVRLMSCQVFETGADGDEVSANNFAAAIKYGADNGAIISQNSWGYDNISALPSSMKAAIDYFIEYAGIDENGNQVGPMKGGVVIFAAGNESSDVGLPASYAPVIAVSALASDFKVSYYSNYGDWIDLSAPGGSYQDNGKYEAENMILSTVTDGEYAWMAGTSMACPHVSGVAALVVSEYGGSGFTADDLKQRLFQGVYNVDGDNSDYAGSLGLGLINAAGTLANQSNRPPEAVSDLNGVVHQNTVALIWTVGADEDDIKAYSYEVFYSPEPFTEEDIVSGNDMVQKVRAYVWHTAAGEKLQYELSGLEFASDYYVAVKAQDVLGASSALSNVFSFSTQQNQPPLIVADSEVTFTMKAHETRVVYCTLTDPEGQSIEWNFQDDSGNAVATGTSRTVMITFSGLNAGPGTYRSTLRATDDSGVSSELGFSYTVEANHIPEVISQIEDTYSGDPDRTISIDLSNYISDEDGEALNYAFDYDDTLLSIGAAGDVITVNPLSMGLATVVVTATDALGESCSTSFRLMVRDDTKEVDVYPNPVADSVYLRMGNTVEGALEVDIYNSSGVLLQSLDGVIGPFEPAQFDLSALKSGTYTLTIKINQKELNRNIVKL